MKKKIGQRKLGNRRPNVYPLGMNSPEYEYAARKSFDLHESMANWMRKKIFLKGWDRELNILREQQRIIDKLIMRKVLK